MFDFSFRFLLYLSCCLSHEKWILTKIKVDLLTPLKKVNKAKCSTWRCINTTHALRCLVFKTKKKQMKAQTVELLIMKYLTSLTRIV